MVTNALLIIERTLIVDTTTLMQWKDEFKVTTDPHSKIFLVVNFCKFNMFTWIITQSIFSNKVKIPHVHNFTF